MANPIKFFRSETAPSNPVEGYIWFNSTNNTIQLYKNRDWEIYTGKINDVTYANGKLTIVPHKGDSVIVDLGAVGNIADLSSRLSTLETNFNILSGEFTTEKGKIATLQDEMSDVKTEVAKLSDVTGKVGAYVVEQFRLHDEERTEIDGGFESRISTLETDHTTLDGKIDGVQSTLQGAIDAEKGRIDTLIGSDANKSVRTIANEELAAQLLGENNAEDNFKTLQELAAWLEAHPESAAEMNEKISANTTNLSTLTSKVENLEAIDHDAYVAADATTLASAKSYADGKASAAESSAKSYTDTLANGQVSTNATNIATNTADIAELKKAWTWAEY